MRPPEFTGGNEPNPHRLAASIVRASMRPPEFTGGNVVDRLAVALRALLQ